MKAFYLRLLCVALAALLLFGLLLEASALPALKEQMAKLTASTDYAASPNEEVLDTLAIVQGKPEATRLVLGDSVCSQVFQAFEPCNEEYALAASNAAMTVAGQYLLAKQFLQYHPQATDIYLVLTAGAFSTTYRSGYGYQYAIEPFATQGLLGEYDAQTRAMQRRACGGFALQPWFLYLFENSAVVRKLYLNGTESLRQLNPPEETILSELSLHSLQNLQQLCDDAGVNFHLVAGPTCNSAEKREQMAQLEQAFRDAGIYEQYQSYFRDVLWFDPSLANSDGVHYAFEKATIAFDAQQLAELQRVTGLFEGICTDLS